MTRIVGIIPARMGSSRFPGKPLARLLDKPMIEHVYRRTAMSKSLDDVYVATCDSEIREVVTGFGGQVIMTSDSHERASDRVAEAVRCIEEQFGKRIDIATMVQGDEPMITPSMIDAAVDPMLRDAEIACVNLVRRISNQSDYIDPNTIKVVMDKHWNALYFSRAPIPAVGSEFLSSTAVFKQVCVIPFRAGFLSEFALLSPTPLERVESIDMLRILEHGGSVHLVETQEETHAVDTPDDLRRVEEAMKALRVLSSHDQTQT